MRIREDNKTKVIRDARRAIVTTLREELQAPIRVNRIMKKSTGKRENERIPTLFPLACLTGDGGKKSPSPLNSRHAYQETSGKNKRMIDKENNGKQ